MLDCPTGGPGCVPDTARHQRWPGPGLGYIQKFIMHYEVLLLIAALPSPAPTTTVTGWAARGAARQVAGQGGGRVRVGEEGSGKGVGALLSSPPAVLLPIRPSAWVAFAWARPLRRVPAPPPLARGGQTPRPARAMVLRRAARMTRSALAAAAPRPHGPHPRRLPPANRARGRAPVRRHCGRYAGGAERASGWPILPRAPGLPGACPWRAAAVLRGTTLWPPRGPSPCARVPAHARMGALVAGARREQGRKGGEGGAQGGGRREGGRVGEGREGAIDRGRIGGRRDQWREER